MPTSCALERSQSQAETVKRLRGLLPFFRHFLEKEPLLMTDLVWEKEARKNISG